MPIKKREAENSLRGKGFKDEGKRDHDYFFFYFNGKKTNAYTYFSHGSESEDVNENLFKVMKRQLQLDNSQQVRDLLSCPLEQKQYIEVLKQKNIINTND